MRVHMCGRTVCKVVILEKREFLFSFFLLMLIYNQLKIKWLTFTEDYFRVNMGKCHKFAMIQRK